MADHVVSASPLHRRVVLLSGAPLAVRAVATALSSCRSVRVAVVPTKLFEQGIGSLVGSWVIGGVPGPSQGHGLSALFDADSITPELRRLGDSVLLSVRGEADVIVDEAPRDATMLKLSAVLYPDACFVHAEWARDAPPDALAAASTIALARVPHLPLSVDRMLIDPEATLASVLAHAGAGDPGSPSIRQSIDELVRSLDDSAAHDAGRRRGRGRRRRQRGD